MLLKTWQTIKVNKKSFNDSQHFIKIISQVTATPHMIHITLAFSASFAAAPVKNTVSDGVRGFFETLIISFSRGTTSVTFLADTPA